VKVEEKTKEKAQDKSVSVDNFVVNTLEQA
jgi:hypothetical protein